MQQEACAWPDCPIALENCKNACERKKQNQMKKQPSTCRRLKLETEAGNEVDVAEEDGEMTRGAKLKKMSAK